MHMRQLFLIGYYFHSNMVAKHVVVTFGLKVEDAFHSFEGVQMKIKEIREQPCSFTKNTAFQKIHLEQKTWLNSTPVENNISLAVGTMKYWISYKCHFLFNLIIIMHIIIK